MSITITRNSVPLPMQEWTFPGGEVGVKLDPPYHYLNGIVSYQVVTARLRSASDIVKLAMIRDALRRVCPIPTRLVLPYVPYARQDRVCSTGESFSILVFADLIRSMNFDHLTIVDPHSAVTEAALRPDVVIRQEDILRTHNEFITRITSAMNDAVILAPDFSAGKRLMDYARWIGKELVIAEKVRELSTGKITHTRIPVSDLGKRDAILIDDICDGGKTFIEIAKALKQCNVGKIVLYVTHGIFSKGLKPLFESGIDEIFTTDTIVPENCKVGTPIPNLNILPITKTLAT